MGLLQKVPLAQEQGKKPMSALALYTTEDSFDDRFSPDLGRFVLDDYRAMLPRYTVLDVKHEKEDNFRIEEGTLMKAAQKAGASYLIIVTLDIKRLDRAGPFLYHAFATCTESRRPRTFHADHGQYPCQL